MARAFILAVVDEEMSQRRQRIERRRFRDISNPLELTENEFIANFRLTKVAYQQVVDELSPHLPNTRRKTGVRNELKILTALNFYASGSYQRNVGASILNNMSQPTVSKCLHEVTLALNNAEILSKYIKFPSTQTQREILMKEFMEKYEFPGIIGCIDGTHVAIIRPSEHEEIYFNRKNYHSLNFLIICDANLNIIHIDASFGGASHDSYVWNQCPVKAVLERLNMNGERCWLLGDSGYAQRPWMMTPILGATPGTPEDFYTNVHCRVRNTVERCIGVLKARWRCLLAHRVLHYEPVTAGKIVNACVVLHNIANLKNAPIPEFDDHTNDHQHFDDIRHTVGTEEITRDILVQRIWNARH